MDLSPDEIVLSKNGSEKTRLMQIRHEDPNFFDGNRQRIYYFILVILNKEAYSCRRRYNAQSTDLKGGERKPPLSIPNPDSERNEKTLS
jgi:hypothetical protein